MNYSDTLFTAAQNSIEEFSNTLDRLIEENESEALTAAAQLFHNKRFAALIRNYFVQSKSALSNTLRKSYFHENGFDKTVLLEGQNFKVRLHKFHPSTQVKAMENVHDHRWMFASAILQGSFQAEFFHKDPNGTENLIRYTYYSDKKNGNYEVELIGFVNLDRQSTVTYNMGDTYLLNPEKLHRICRVGEEGATTVIITGKPRRNYCKLYSKTPFSNKKPSLQPLKETQIISLINKIAA